MSRISQNKQIDLEIEITLNSQVSKRVSVISIYGTFFNTTSLHQIWLMFQTIEKYAKTI
jgi:hypothetical protein